MRLLIYGSGAFTQTVIELVQDCGHEVVGLVDDTHRGPGVLGNLEEVSQSYPPGKFGIAIAIGYGNLSGRWNAWQRARAYGYQAPVLIHPRGYVAGSAQVGEGSMVMASAVVDVRATVGEAVVLWPGVCVSHDSMIGENCFLSPNATVCGAVRLGANSFVGAGAAIADQCEVPPSSYIKMLERFTGRAT